ncbi:MAG: HlyC/CorC family transporter [Anaerolineales bacterium]|uniref:HlyC/CorC family transporter n=1 Tax=Candidatus Desulfolinea nitratireducens TaxID=2841698 RepID=A0A8J6NHQ6_9CHLR|nr:HlyC/CorC family transporter [Candidatus Desulfolinea nitratireducens]
MIIWDIFVILILIALNGYFVGVEFAIVTSRRTRIDSLAEDGHRGANIVQGWLSNPATRDRVIAAAQLGITIVSLALGAVGENTFEELLAPYFHDMILPENLQFMGSVIAALPLIISLTVVTTLHVVLGEQVPKITALNSPERFSTTTASSMSIFMKAFSGFVSLLDWLTRGTLGLFGLDGEASHNTVYTVEELKTIVSGPDTEGIIQQPQREMLSAIFDFGKLVVRQVMIPRTEITAIQADTPLYDAAALIRENVYTKFPVFGEDLDDVVGILHVKDLLNRLEDPNNRETPAKDLMREALFVPETISVTKLLHEFRDGHQHIAISLDEYGGTAGLVTLEDLLEEIIGDIRDPFDDNLPEIQIQPGGSILLDGLALIEYVNQQTGLSLTDENYDTIGGFVMGRLGRIPNLDDQIEIPEDNICLKVTEMEGMRISRIELTLLKEE